MLELSLVLDAVLKLPEISWAYFRIFMETNWQFCSAVTQGRDQLRNCWSDAREKAFCKSKEFKTGSSEVLMLVPVFLYFLEIHVAPQNASEAELRSYRALALVLACIKDAKFGRNVEETAAALRRSFGAHGRCFEEAYSNAVEIPKGHWGLFATDSHWIAFAWNAITDSLSNAPRPFQTLAIMRNRYSCGCWPAV